MALEALYNVIHNNAGVETQCNGHFNLLFSFFRFQGAKKLQMLTLKVHKTRTLIDLGVTLPHNSMKIKV